MNIYNQNEEFVTYGIEYINGYLSSLAILKDYITKEVGFNFYFKLIGKSENLHYNFNSELNWALKRYIGEKGVNKLTRIEPKLTKIDNWEFEINKMLDPWIGRGLTDAIKNERKTWDDKENLVVIDLVNHLKLFFNNQRIEVYKLEAQFKTKLPIQWGWLRFEDFIFENGKETYLLHLDLSD